MFDRAMKLCQGGVVDEMLGSSSAAVKKFKHAHRLLEQLLREAEDALTAVCGSSLSCQGGAGADRGKSDAAARSLDLQKDISALRTCLNCIFTRIDEASGGRHSHNEVFARRSRSAASGTGLPLPAVPSCIPASAAAALPPDPALAQQPHFEYSVGGGGVGGGGVPSSSSSSHSHSPGFTGLSGNNSPVSFSRNNSHGNLSSLGLGGGADQQGSTGLLPTMHYQQLQPQQMYGGGGPTHSYHNYSNVSSRAPSLQSSMTSFAAPGTSPGVSSAVAMMTSFGDHTSPHTSPQMQGADTPAGGVLQQMNNINLNPNHHQQHYPQQQQQLMGYAAVDRAAAYNAQVYGSPPFQGNPAGQGFLPSQPQGKPTTMLMMMQGHEQQRSPPF